MRARLSTFVYICSAVVSLAAQSQSSQTPAPAPSRDVPQTTFRTGANYVRVDMYATRDGVPVEDLTTDEVEVLEDGVAQKVDAFEHVKVPTDVPQDARIEPNTIAESRRMAADPRARVMVIFLDTYHTQFEGSATMRQPLVRFIDSVLGPDDLIAVMTPEMAASDLTFARKTTVISNMVNNNTFWGRRGRGPADQDSKEQLYDSCYPAERNDVVNGSFQSPVAREMKERRREKLTLDAIQDLTTHLTGIREERKAVLVVTEGWRMLGPNPALAKMSKEESNSPTPPPPGPFTRGRQDDGTTSNNTTGSMRSECLADKQALALLDHRTRLRELSDDANRGNVSFYTIYARGLVAFDSPIGPDRPPSLQEDRQNLSARQDSLRYLAEQTDATWVINTNNIEGAMRRITADLSSYYLLGYNSSNSKLDGKFRNITVRVKRPGVQVRARRGYRGPTADAVLSATEKAGGAPSSTIANAFSAVAATNTRSPFRVRTASWRASADDASAWLWIVGELDFATRRDVAWSSGAKADITVVAGDGKQIASSTIDVPASDGGFTLRIPESGGVAPGDYAVRVRLRAEADPSATVSDSARAVVVAQAPRLGEAIMSRRGPSTGLRYLSTADPRFQRTERLRLEFPTTAAGAATGRMLDRTGKPIQMPVQITERADSSGQFRWIVADATLAPLAAGDYAVEVTLDDAKQVTGFRVVP